MIRESIAIIIVCGLLIGSSIRTRHFGYALSVLPVGIIPLVHVIMAGVLYLSDGQFFGIRAPVVMAFTDVVGLVGTCIAVMLFSGRFQSKRTKTIYLVVMLVYAVLLGWLYLYDSLQGLLG